MSRASTKFVSAPLCTGNWLVRERGSGALFDTLVPPGALSPLTDGDLDSCWRLWSYARPSLGQDGQVEGRLLTVRQALAFVRADDEQRAWVYERSIYYAQHLLTEAVEHLAYDRERARDVTETLTYPAIQLLDEVREAAGSAGLPEYVRAVAIGVLPDLALVVLGITDDEAQRGVVAGRV